MNNIIITIATDTNKIITSGYNPSFYETEAKQFEDVVKDLENIKKNLADEKLFICVATWADKKENSSGLIYETIDELINDFKSKE